LKVLIAGGYSYLGLNISKKFVEEKHAVTIIDSLPSGRKTQLPFKHKFYNLKLQDPQCRKVFESAVFDIVIFISGTLDCKSASSNNTDMSGVVNIANLSSDLKVKKFILLTSTEIYGDAASPENLPFTENSKLNPATPAGMGDNVREYFAIKAGKLSKMPVLCLRISDFYGPCIIPGSDSSYLNEADLKNTGNLKEMHGGNISFYIDSALKNKKIITSGNPESSRDYIYIDDAVSAIYIASIDRGLSGIFNVSTQVETTFKKIAEILSGIIKVKHAKSKKNKKPGMVSRKYISNKNLKDATGWKPLTDIESGIKKLC
jgi:nucleoside-diphosphate-sugar epimerase